MQLAIEVTKVSKSFRRYRPDRPHTLQEVFARGLTGIRATERFWALRDVSFSVPRGRAVGIIGTNGSGKSTLLRLVGGIGSVDSGRVHVAGRIGALLDLGSGLHGDLTGRENVIVAGVLNGLTRHEVLRRLDDIVAFSEIEKFIDNPMRTYSSGMQMRLAFAVNVHTNPDVLLIDEVLAVGDAPFQRKCLERIRAFKANGCSILLVSHGLSVVRKLCDEVLWMKAGHLMAHGPVPDVLRQYEANVGYSIREPDEDPEVTPAVAALARPTTPTPLPNTARPPGRGDRRAAATLADAPRPFSEVEISAVTLFDDNSHPLEQLRTGDPLRLEIEYRTARGAATPPFRVRIVREDGLVCYDLSRNTSDSGPPGAAGANRVTLVLDRVDLNSGSYRVDVWTSPRGGADVLERPVAACALTVIGDGDHEAVLNVPHRWEYALAPAHAGD